MCNCICATVNDGVGRLSGTVESINMRGGPLPYTGKNLALSWVYALRKVFLIPIFLPNPRTGEKYISRRVYSRKR